MELLFRLIKEKGYITDQYKRISIMEHYHEHMENKDMSVFRNPGVTEVRACWRLPDPRFIGLIVRYSRIDFMRTERNVHLKYVQQFSTLPKDDFEPDLLELLAHDMPRLDFVVTSCGYVIYQPENRLEKVRVCQLLSEHESSMRVHGGVTYLEMDRDEDYVVCGFDCNHLGNAEDPVVQSMDYLFKEVYSLYSQVRMLLMRHAFA